MRSRASDETPRTEPFHRAGTLHRSLRDGSRELLFDPQGRRAAPARRRVVLSLIAAGLLGAATPSGRVSRTSPAGRDRSRRPRRGLDESPSQGYVSTSERTAFWRHRRTSPRLPIDPGADGGPRAVDPGPHIRDTPRGPNLSMPSMRFRRGPRGRGLRRRGEMIAAVSDFSTTT
jgi:hypothetical protein